MDLETPSFSSVSPLISRPLNLFIEPSTDSERSASSMSLDSLVSLSSMDPRLGNFSSQNTVRNIVAPTDPENSILDNVYAITLDFLQDTRKSIQSVVNQSVHDAVLNFRPPTSVEESIISKYEMVIHEMITTEIAKIDDMAIEEIAKIPDRFVYELNRGSTVSLHEIWDLCAMKFMDRSPQLYNIVTNKLASLNLRSVITDKLQNQKEETGDSSSSVNHQLRILNQETHQLRDSRTIYEQYIQRHRHDSSLKGKWISILDNNTDTIECFDSYQDAATQYINNNPDKLWFCEQYRDNPIYISPVVTANFNISEPSLAFVTATISNPVDRTKAPTRQLMMIDTGSEICLGTIEIIVGKLRARPNGTVKNATGIGGTITVAEYLVEIKIGDLPARFIPIGVPSPPLPPDNPVKWILGQTFLRQCQHHWDLPTNPLPTVHIAYPPHIPLQPVIPPPNIPVVQPILLQPVG